MTADLVQFLRARLNEDEQAARVATPGTWSTRNLGRHDLSAVAQGPSVLAQTDSSRGAADGVHIARHDPARVLAEVDAKRRLLEVHQRDTRYSFSGCITCDAGDNSCGCMGGSAYEYPCETLRLLALPYAAHPDYRSEWAP